MIERPFDGESVLKPLTDIERAINNTSTGDMLLFMISLGRKEREDEAKAKGLTDAKTSVN
jgi:hypothetical protein